MKYLSVVICCTLGSAYAGSIIAADSPDPAADEGDSLSLEAITVMSKREDRISTGATGLRLELMDTPQSISILDDRLMADFGADNINDALKFSTGVQVEEWETNRSNYTARGFDVVNTQIDGAGMPNNWGIVSGAMDSYFYEKIEIIRGANGLLTGLGNSAGTVNYVRKRPTNERQGEVRLTFGSYEKKRFEADYSTPLTEDGRWAGRFVMAAEDKESHLRGMSNDRIFLYGVVDGQIGDKSTLTLGLSRQDANTDGNMWGALVLGNADGSQAEWDRDASTTVDWTYWNTINTTAFAEFTHLLSDNWEAKLAYNYRTFEDKDKLFYVYSTEGLDPDTGEGLYGWPGRYATDQNSQILDASVSGEFQFAERWHALTAGISYAEGDNDLSYYPVDGADPAFGALPAFPYAGNVVPEPVWGEKADYSDEHSERTRVYAAGNFQLTDSLASVIGVNAVKFERTGDNSGVDVDQSEEEVSPYVGLVYDVNDDLMAYASYSDIYQNQDQYDITGKYLPAMKGVNYEAGIKSEWLEDRLQATLAVFSAEQQGVATFAGVTDDLRWYYEGTDIKSEGLELELTGQVNEFLELSAGLSSLELTDKDGEDANTWIPRKTFNFAVRGKLPALPALRLGVAGKWQDDISTVDDVTGTAIKQDAYVLLDGFVAYDISESASIKLNVKNITDEKYITSLYQVGYYGAPRSAYISLDYKF
ncbi:MAG: TonB-dependent siderophore receptor [Gammaproteobacteria bacterium]|nr:TonB-dependent siderophore receptor [Gammaproteobacteria bacterium]